MKVRAVAQLSPHVLNNCRFGVRNVIRHAASRLCCGL
jgi:hypothetical protein